MSYPTSIDSIPQPSSTSPTNNPGAAEVSTAQTNAIVAVETKVGTGASTPTSGTVLTGNGTGTSTWGGTTGSGNVVLATSPTLVTPALGTPASGVATNLTGTASGLTAGYVTTNANLTGPITSSGNATSIASQTGIGSKFVVDTSPTIVTPTIVKNANPVMSLNGNPVWQYLNYAQITAYQSTASGSFVAISGLSVGVTVPSGATAVRVTVFARDFTNSTAGDYATIGIFSGATSATLTTQLAASQTQSASSGGNSSPVNCQAIIKSPTSGSIYYTAALMANAGSGTAAIEVGTTYPMFILVECC
jgi:hypothetical protein